MTTLRETVVQAIVDELRRQLIQFGTPPAPARPLAPAPLPSPARLGSPMPSQAAIDMIVDLEITGDSYYQKHYTHFDWPGGASGPTVGIGYDLGYCAPAEIRADWTGLVDAATLGCLVAGAGHRGSDAQSFVNANRTADTITIEQARSEFATRELPKWQARVNSSLPNTALLSGDSYGALVSLAYNRGCSFDLPGTRYAEMRAIKLHMQAKEFAKIPGEIRSMKRLWPGTSGLLSRRDREAKLFEAGLANQAAA